MTSSAAAPHCRNGLLTARFAHVSPWRTALLLHALAALLWIVLPASAQTDGANASPRVYIAPISGPIDLGLAPYLSRVLEEAEAAGADAVLVPIDTPGGRLDAVLQMRDALLGSEVPTIAFVDRVAFSAGALIAIACDEIYMAPGAVMGAATPIDGATGDAAEEKIISAVRTTFKATAEARGRDPLVAEAMVDPDVAIAGLVTRGDLLTLTANEALAWGYAEGIVNSQAEVLAAAGLPEATRVETSPSLPEHLVRFITDPAISTVIIALGVLLLIGDLFIEGFGIAGAAGLTLLALFFWGHYLAGLTGLEDIALVVLGLLLIAGEILVVPGFGVPGVLGLAALLGGLFLAMVGRDVASPAGLEQAAFTIGASFILIVLGLAAIVTLLSRGRRPGRLVLQSTVAGPAGAPGAASAGWLGWFGASARLARNSAERTSVAKRASAGTTAAGDERVAAEMGAPASGADPHRGTRPGDV